MEVSVLVEPIAGRRYRARVFDLTGEGESRDEALDRLREQVADRLAAGAMLVPFEIPTEHPLTRFAGHLKNHPLLDEWLEAMAEARREVVEGALRP